MLVYDGKILHLAHDPKEDMNALNHTHILKDGIIGPTKIYIGAKSEKVRMENVKYCCPIHCVDYLQGAIRNVKDILSKDHGYCLKKY